MMSDSSAEQTDLSPEVRRIWWGPTASAGFGALNHGWHPSGKAVGRYRSVDKGVRSDHRVITNLTTSDDTRLRSDPTPVPNPDWSLQYRTGSRWMVGVVVMVPNAHQLCNHRVTADPDPFRCSDDAHARNEYVIPNDDGCSGLSNDRGAFTDLNPATDLDTRTVQGMDAHASAQPKT